MNRLRAVAQGVIVAIVLLGGAAALGLAWRIFAFSAGIGG